MHTSPTLSPSSAGQPVTGTDLPPSGVWEIDPGHAEVAFVGRHFGLTKIRGRFTDVTGQATITGGPDESSVTVTIGMASVSSGDESRDEHLRSADFFDVAEHPTATFVSRRVAHHGNRAATISGDLTIRGVTRTVDLAAEYVGAVRDPWGSERVVFTAAATIDRENWGLTWNMLLEAGGLLVSKEIRLEIDVELVRRA